MLTGAARAAVKMGGTRLERVWIVALPVVLMLVLERLYLYIVVAFYVGFDPRAALVGRADPWPLRTTLVIVAWVAAGYALLWALAAIGDYVREVRRRGKRLLLTGAGGRLLVLGSLFIAVAYDVAVLSTIPNREEVMATARADFRAGRWRSLMDVVVNDVPGAREFCRESLENPSRPHRLMAAAGLHQLGNGDEETNALLGSMTLVEFRDWGYHNHYVLLFRPNLWPVFDGLDGDGGEPWRRFRERFPE